MPRAQPSTAGMWFHNQLWNTSLPWLAVVAFGMTGFYFLTNAKLDSHDQKFLSIESKISAQAALLAETKRIEASEREKVRDAFLMESKATSVGISELNKQTAVMGVQLMAIKDELAKIGGKLESRDNGRESVIR